MSRTLFWYILKDLLRIFLMSSGVLAGIMSFGGLLRPLTEHGLSMGQVAHMLTYFQFPMTAYSLPIAALFATTIVYGRLSADNEIVACRAAGISHLSMAVPAFVLGLSVAIASLLLLSFVVPVFMLKAEKVIFSNAGQIIVNEIERTHQLKLEQEGEGVTVFAQSAKVMPSDPTRPSDQVVVLESPMFVNFEANPDRSPDAIRTPKDFYVAKQATCYINQNVQTDEMSFFTVLTDGCKFPRTFHGMEGGVGQTTYAAKGESQVRETSKFMDIWRLKELLKDESSASRVRKVLDAFILNEQKDAFLKAINNQLGGEQSQARLAGTEDKQAIEYILMRGKAATSLEDNKLTIGSATADITRPVRVFQEKDGQVLRTFEAQQIEISVIPDQEVSTMHVRIELNDVIERVGEDTTQRTKIPREFDVPMSATIHQLPQIRTAKYYISNSKLFGAEQGADPRADLHLEHGSRRTAFPRQLRDELPDSRHGGLCPGHDVPQRQFPQRLRAEHRSRADLHRTDHHRAAHGGERSEGADEFSQPLRAWPHDHLEREYRGGGDRGGVVGEIAKTISTKSEMRNSKQIPIKKEEIGKGIVWGFAFSAFEFVSNFVFRISNL